MTHFIFQEPTLYHYDEEDGSLCCVLKQQRKRLRVRPWEEGCRVEYLQESGSLRPGKNPWIDALDEIDLPVFSTRLTGGDLSHPIARYTATLPPDAAEAVAVFPSSRLVLLRICASSERGRQLLHTQPILLWLAAPSLLRHANGSPERLHDLLGLRRRELLTLACGRNSQSLIRILGKIIPPKAAQTQRELVLDILTSEENTKILRHKRDISWASLNVINRWKEHIADKVIHSILASDMSAQEMETALASLEGIRKDTVRLGQALRITEAQRVVQTCASRQQLLHLHDLWTERLNNMREFAKKAKLSAPFPPPPIPGNAHIQPIITESMLLEEGRILRHCVGSYAASVRKGECYIYRILHPERATLEIGPNGQGGSALRQIKGYCNAKPGPGVMELVHQWLHQHNTR